MSYDKTPQINARSRADGRFLERMENIRRFRFLQKLSTSGVRLTEWEQKFVESLLRREQAMHESGAPIRFSDREREKIRQLKQQYGVRVC